MNIYLCSKGILIDNKTLYVSGQIGLDPKVSDNCTHTHTYR